MENDIEWVCGESYDHTERLTYSEKGYEQWECTNCGAEWWIDPEDGALGFIDPENAI